MSDSFTRKQMIQILELVFLFDIGLVGLYKLWATKEQAQQNHPALTHVADIISNLL